jgi:hypothetical protein
VKYCLSSVAVRLFVCYTRGVAHPCGVRDRRERHAGIMKVALMVAEKPSLAASLANILSNGKNSSKKGMKSHSLRVVETPWRSYRFSLGVASQEC